jgi:hypothetical protein
MNSRCGAILGGDFGAGGLPRDTLTTIIYGF